MENNEFVRDGFDATSFKEGYISATLGRGCKETDVFYFDVENADPGAMLKRAFTFECVERVAFHKAETNPECLVMSVFLNKDKCVKKNNNEQIREENFRNFREDSNREDFRG